LGSGGGGGGAGGGGGGGTARSGGAVGWAPAGALDCAAAEPAMQKAVTHTATVENRDLGASRRIGGRELHEGTPARQPDRTDAKS